MTILSIFGMELDKVILNFFMKGKKGLILNILMMECGEEVFISHNIKDKPFYLRKQCKLMSHQFIQLHYQSLEVAL